MALIIETGAGLSNATSYVTVAEARSYALARGVTLSATDGVVETQILNGMDWLESLDSSYQGYPKWPSVMGTHEHEQALAWPRECVYINGYYLRSDVIPVQLKNALCQLCIEQHNGVDIMPNSTGKTVIRKKIGPLETEYSDMGGNNSPNPSLRKVTALLRPILNGTAGTTYIIRS